MSRDGPSTGALPLHGRSRPLCQPPSLLAGPGIRRTPGRQQRPLRRRTSRSPPPRSASSGGSTLVSSVCWLARRRTPRSRSGRLTVSARRDVRLHLAGFKNSAASHPGATMTLARPCTGFRISAAPAAVTCCLPARPWSATRTGTRRTRPGHGSPLRSCRSDGTRLPR